MLRSDIMNPLDQNLQEITASVVRMLSFVRESCELAKHALIDGDVAAAERCADNDQQIDALEAQLEQTILTVIARRQPAASDLRFLGAMHRALADIERAGDNAKHVARVGAELAEKPPIKKYVDTVRIFEVLSMMNERTIKAIAESDASAAREAHAMDDEIDDLYEQIQRELLTYMMENPKLIGQATKLLSVARHLERIGDHFENVNEHTLYWLTGERFAVAHP
jgi:phosphate transport system protein